MSFLPLGIRITPCAYASSANSFTRFPAGTRRACSARARSTAMASASTLAHAGHQPRALLRQARPLTLRGHWEARHLAEWGLRFWIVLVLRWTPPGDGRRPWNGRYDSESGELAASIAASHAVVIRGERLPLLATFHDSLEALQREYETKGYFCLDSRGERGRVAVLRYHLEEMPRFAFAAVIADDGKAASARASAALASAPAASLRPLQSGRHAGALDAVRDVIGWNTVWDGANRRPYTSLSRNWVAQKFGGWGVWLNDVLYHGLMAGLFDTEIARENLAAVFAGATPAGNLPCLLTGRDSWVDRSQPPIGAFIVWMLYLRTRDTRPAAATATPCSPATTTGGGGRATATATASSNTAPRRWAGGSIAAPSSPPRTSSSMDNSPTHDEATLAHRRLDPRLRRCRPQQPAGARWRDAREHGAGARAGRPKPSGFASARGGAQGAHPRAAVGRRAPRLRQPAVVRQVHAPAWRRPASIR